jgi:hypothetical protein
MSWWENYPFFFDKMVFRFIHMIRFCCFVMRGLVPGIHGIGRGVAAVSWMGGTSQDKPGHDK